ncbi:hypothetical protein GQ42DRAFT_162519 [Ramicandelaber brevisporus]|nr:hypothetical protein GQ42DRAFT_162519 [Ramicandelaber brevisporus]
MVNYFGHQLLTSLLMDALGGKLREVVNVSSGLAKNAPLDIAVDILNPDESKYSAKDMYTLSKLYMDAMAYKIDSDANSPTRALSVYPGFVPNTNLGRDFAWYERLFTSLMAYMPFATSEQGAVGYIVNAALSINQHEKGTVINQKGTWIPYSQRAKDIASSSLPSLQSI